jgi:MFS family permease
MDRLGTRRVMLYTTLGGACAALLYPAIPWIAALFVVQILTGIFMTFNWIGAQTLIAQICRGDAVSLGRFNFVCRFGTVGAPIIAGIIWDIGGAWPTFTMIAAWAFLMHLMVRFITPPPEESQTKGSVAGADQPSLRAALPRLSDYRRSLALLVIPAVAFTVAVAGLRNGASGIQNSIYIVYLEGIGFTGTKLGILFAALEITIGLASLVVGTVRRLGKAEWVLLVTSFISITMIAITPLIGGVFAMLLVIQLLRGLAQGFMQPLMFSIQSLAVGPDHQGAVVGLRVTANRVFGAILPLLMGIVADTVSLEASFLLTWAFLLVGLVALAVLVIVRPEFRMEEYAGNRRKLEFDP